MAYEVLRETCFFKTGRKGIVLEFLDEMYPNQFNRNDSINNDIFKKYSKIKVTLIDSRNSGNEKGKAVDYNLDPAEATLLAHLLSDGNPESFKKRVGAYNSFDPMSQIYLKNLTRTFGKVDFSRFDQVLKEKGGNLSTAINFQKNISAGGDNLTVRKFTLSYEEAMRNASKWKITIEQGTATKDTTKGNGLNIVKSGTYKSLLKNSFNVQVEEIVIPINEAAERVYAACSSFYPIMKMAETNFTQKKLESKDFKGEKIDEWNPKGEIVNRAKSVNKNIESKPQENKDTPKNDAPVTPETIKTNESEKSSDKKDLRICSSCNKSISEKIEKYSMNVFKTPLCMDCQKTFKKNA